MDAPDARQRRLAVLVALALVSTAAIILHGPIQQDPGYHRFADQRRLCGIPNFWNVISNLPFLLIGCAGIRILLRRPTPGGLPSLRPAYLSFFLGAVLVSVGSAAYHIAPTDETLVWDRLPLTITFMAFLAVILGEQVDPALGARLLWPLLVLGIFAVAFWLLTSRSGHGDLRPYVVVQYVPMVLTPMLLVLFPSPFSSTGHLWALVGAYGGAKVLELLDERAFNALRVLSGHTLKHVVAALGTFFLLQAIRRRRLRQDVLADCPPELNERA